MQRRMLVLTLVLGSLAAGGGFLWQKPETTAGNLTAAGEAFLASLTDAQTKIALLDYNDPKRLDWHFIPKESRKGLQLREMNDAQKKAALALLRAGLSQIGYDKATQIMELEQILKKLEGEKARFLRDNLRYYVTIFGKPTQDGTWGLSIEGHHLSLNWVVAQGKVVAHTPHFFGANPAEVKGDYGVGPAKGTRTLRPEEELAFKLVNSLNEEQKKAAILKPKAPADIRGPAGAQPPQGSSEGLSAAKLTADQQGTLLALIKSYTDSMATELGAARLSEAQKTPLADLYFSWEGATAPGVGHYYKIQAPAFLIEFVNVQPDAAGNVANHIHAVWRDMRGDFGVALKK